MVRQIEVNGERVIIGANRQNALVASASQPGMWHVVSRGQCDCLGFQYRGRCRHLRAVESLAGLPSETTIPTTFELAEKTMLGAFDH